MVYSVSIPTSSLWKFWFLYSLSEFDKSFLMPMCFLSIYSNVWERLELFLPWTLERTLQWSYLGLVFFMGRLVTPSIYVTVIGLFRFSVSSFISVGKAFFYEIFHNILVIFLMSIACAVMPLGRLCLLTLSVLRFYVWYTV